MIKRLRVNAMNRKNQMFKLWMDRFDDFVIESEDTLQVKIEYIHNNPVKAGLVDRPEQWEFSSARNYILDGHSVIEVMTDWAMPVLEEKVSGRKT